MKHPKYASALHSAGFTREPGSDYHYGNPVTGVVLLAGATGIQLAMVVLWTEEDFRVFAQEFVKYRGQPTARLRVIRKT